MFTNLRTFVAEIFLRSLLHNFCRRRTDAIMHALVVCIAELFGPVLFVVKPEMQ